MSCARDHDEAAELAEEWARSVLSKFAQAQLNEPVSVMGASQLEGVHEDPEGVVGRANLVLAKALIPEALRRGLNDPRAVYQLADLMTAGPEAHRDPELALRYARRAVELKSGDAMCQQSLGWALYRTGDWKGCIETREKQVSYVQNGSFFAAMAYWQLGDKSRAREQFARADKWTDGYLKRCEERKKLGQITYPDPSLFRRIRSEAAALIGSEQLRGEADSKDAHDPSGPPTRPR